MTITVEQLRRQTIEHPTDCIVLLDDEYKAIEKELRELPIPWVNNGETSTSRAIRINGVSILRGDLRSARSARP